VKTKTSELQGTALDYAVARALGKRPSLFIVKQTGTLAKEHNYSTDWAQGGPIIEREVVELRYRGAWQASFCFDNNLCAIQQATTPLIAAMRCYVASKLSDEVEVPDRLR
jgi:hypothetical protein